MAGDLSHGEYRDAGGPELAAQHHELVISRMSACIVAARIVSAAPRRP